MKNIIKKLLREAIDTSKLYNINESATKKEVIDFILDFNVLLSLNLAMVKNQAKDEKSKLALIQMQQKFRTPVINGKTFFELADERITPRKDLFNPRFLSAYLTQIRNYLVYIKEHINRFVVDGIYKTGWLDRIAKLEATYKNIIGANQISENENSGLINENIDEEYYDELKPLEGYVDAEELIGNRLWFHTNRTHRNQGKNGMIGIYSVNKNGNRETSINRYTNEVRIGAPIVFQTSESGAKQIQKSFDSGTNRRVLIAGISGVVIPTRSGDNGGMVKIQFNPFDESPWFYAVGDSEKKEIISASEVYFNASKSGEWEIYVYNPIYSEQKPLKSLD